MTLQSWIELGSAERINDAISDIEWALDQYEDSTRYVRRKARGKNTPHIAITPSEASAQLEEAADLAEDNVVAYLRVQIEEAKEALTRVPREDATQGEQQDWGRSRAERETY